MSGNVANRGRNPRTGVIYWSRLVAITHPGFGQQMTGPRRVILQLAAQASHVKAEVIGALLEPGTPDRGQDLRRPDQLARSAEQDLQDPPFGRSEPERPPLTAVAFVAAQHGAQ